MAKFENLLNGIKDKFKNDTKRRCSHCGAVLLSDDSLFCHVCGAKRDQCSCGAILYDEIKFCPRCGKITPAEQKRQEQEKKAQEEQKRKQEEENRIKAREKILKSDPKNFLDRGDFVELVEPICGIHMIQKGTLEREGFLFRHVMFNWLDANKFAKELNYGGFQDWRLPTIEELTVVYQVRDICGLDKLGGLVWSSSTAHYKTAFCLNFSKGEIWETGIANYYNVRYVR